MKKLLLCFLVLLTLVGCSSGKKITTPEIIDFTLDGHYYVLPADVKEFTDEGWRFCDLDEFEDEIILEKGYYVRVYYCKGNIELRLTIANSTSQAVAINDAKVIGIVFDAWNIGNVDDNYISVKGINLSTSFNDAAKAWKDYPNFESYGSWISYSIPSAQYTYSHEGEIEIAFYENLPDYFSIFVEDYFDYTHFMSPSLIREYTDYDKADAINVTDGYKVALSLDYTIGYFKGIVIEETTIYRDYGDFIDKYLGYLIEDELGQQVAVYVYYYDDVDVSLEIGQEYEFWGELRQNHYIELDSPIVTIELQYINKDEVEIFNYWTLEY